MKKFYVLLVWLVFTVSGFAQTLTVKDQQTDEPIEWATISDESAGLFVTTNAKGQATITSFSKSQKILVRSLGYQLLELSFAQLKAANYLVKLAPSNLNLNEVVVSASRWKQNSSNVPQKITSISPREVALQNPQSSADMLSISGKVYVQKSQQGGGSPMIRGFATNRLLYTVDGVRMNTAIFRSGNIQNVINLDPFAIENTEVLFGPGSVIYGSDAIGGVMSFQTLVPELALDDEMLVIGKALTRYSSANNEKTGHFDINVGWKKWAFVSSFSSWDFDNLRQGSQGPEDYVKPFYVQRIDSTDHIITQNDPLLQIPTAYSQINFMQKVRFKASEKWDFQYGFHFSETSEYGRYDRYNRMRNGTARYAEWNYGPQKWLMTNFTISNSAHNPVYDQMTIRLAQQTFVESRIDRSLNSDERNTQAENVLAYSANVDFVKMLGEKHTLFYGAEFVQNDVKSTGTLTDISTNTDVDGPARYPASTWTSLAVYINDQFKVNEKFTLQGGLRYSQVILNSDFNYNLAYYPFPFSTAEMNNGALTGSIGAVYRPARTWVFSSNFGTAFRAPNVDDVGKVFDSEPGTVTVPNPDLEAEYAYNIDLSVAKVFADVLKIDVTGYYTLLNNAMVRRPFKINGQDSIVYDGELSQVEAIQNAAVANVYGVQIGLEAKLPAGFTFSSQLNYQIGEEELDDGNISAARHAAPMFGVSRLTYTSHKLSLQFYSNYQAERAFEDLAEEEQGKDEIYAKDENGNNYSPAWYTVNIKAMYQISDHFSVSAGVENMTDQRYRMYSSGISAPGRNFVMSLKANF